MTRNKKGQFVGYHKVSKFCIYCKKKFYVGYDRRFSAKWCSRFCRSKSMKGSPSFFPIPKGVTSNTGKTHFKKGELENEKNFQWKGQEASYSAIHHWLKRKLGKPNMCKICGKTTGKFEWANVSRAYKRDLNDYISLCYSCHDKYDNARQKMWETRRQKNV